MAGKTEGIAESTFNIVIFEIESEEDAIIIKRNNFAVAEGIMIAELFAYKVA